MSLRCGAPNATARCIKRKVCRPTCLATARAPVARRPAGLASSGPLGSCSVLSGQSSWRRACSIPVPRRRTIARVESESGMLVPLGLDFLTFLASTVLVIPLFKSLKLSPILGFLFSGVVLKQLGLFQDLEDTERLAELGVLFLLFEMGLELSLDRLKSLAKFAFGLGSLQVFLSTVIFTAFSLPVGHGLGTWFLETVAHAPHRLVSIRSVDEAVVIGAALSMSSSAFVLQLLRERGEMNTRFGNATLGVLLFQDIAVVPFLVLLPLITNHSSSELLEGAASPVSLVTMLLPTALQTVAGLGALLLADRLVMRRIFEMVAQSRNSETFIALCLLTVAGTSLITQRLGLSDSMGAFLAGVLLSETSYRTQVEADIRPFKGLLLGLFFVTTGCSVNLSFLQAHWQESLWMLAGLVTIKASVVAAAGQLLGLTRSEAIRTGFVLSQGGEFAFVLLSLANQLRILPTSLNQLLIIVVVLSMALTPFLAEAGKVVAYKLDEVFPPKGSPAAAAAAAAAAGGATITVEAHDVEPLHQATDAVVICGFSPAGQMVANMLESPLASADGAKLPPYLAFDLDPDRVAAGRKAGFKVTFGDGTRPVVLRAAGVEAPRAVAVCYADKEQALAAVGALRSDFPAVPIFACAADLRHAAELEEAGADHVVIRSVEAGLAMGGQLLQELGADDIDLNVVKRGIEETIGARTTALADWMQNNTESVPAFSSLDMIVLTGDMDIAREVSAAAAAIVAAERDKELAEALNAEAAQPGTPLKSAPSPVASLSSVSSATSSMSSPTGSVDEIAMASAIASATSGSGGEAGVAAAAAQVAAAAAAARPAKNVDWELEAELEGYGRAAPTPRSGGSAAASPGPSVVGSVEEGARSSADARESVIPAALRSRERES